MLHRNTFLLFIFTTELIFFFFLCVVFTHRNSNMLLFSRTGFFTSSRREAAAAAFRHGAAAGSRGPAAPQTPQQFPGKAVLTHFSGSGCLPLPQLTTANILLSAAGPGHQGPLPYCDGHELYCAELLFLLGKGKEHYSSQGRERGLLFTHGSREMDHS